MFVRPWPATTVASSKPGPSSWTVRVSVPSSTRTSIVTWASLPACLAAFCTASAQQK